MAGFNRYTQNLSVVNHDGNDYVQSYATRVARIDYEKMELIVLGYWSMTTSKHINYAGSELGLTVIKEK